LYGGNISNREYIMELFIAGIVVVNLLQLRKAITEAWNTYEKERKEIKETA